jgi:hypothetical protein
MRRLLAPSLVLALAIPAVACGGADGGQNPPGLGGEVGGDGTGSPGGRGPITIGPDGLPVGPDGKPVAPKLDGRYELSNQFDLTTAGIFPNAANDTLKALSNFREKPSQTLVDLLDVANVPVVPNLLNAIPSPIRGLVLGYIDEHVFKALYKNVPVTKTITGVLDDLATLTTKFQLVTTLDLPEGDAIGDARAHHAFKGVAYDWSQQRHVVEAPQVVQGLQVIPVEANAVALEKRSTELETGRLALGDHTFSVPIGSFAVFAADWLSREKFGAADLRDAIGKVVDCKAMALAVSKRCIDPIGPGKVCVDHEREIENMCKIGLDVLVSTLKSQIKKLDLPLLRLEDGQAQMWDAPAEGAPLDAVVDRLDKGYWTSFIRVGAEEKPVLSSFSGVRVGDYSPPAVP